MSCESNSKSYLERYSLSFGRAEINLKIKKKKKKEGEKAKAATPTVIVKTVSCYRTDIPQLKCFFFPPALINISGQ